MNLSPHLTCEDEAHPRGKVLRFAGEADFIAVPAVRQLLKGLACRDFFCQFALDQLKDSISTPRASKTRPTVLLRSGRPPQPAPTTQPPVLKTAMRRFVTIQPNLRALLMPRRQLKGAVTPVDNLGALAQDPPL
jgi:hypothetical protein